MPRTPFMRIVPSIASLVGIALAFAALRLPNRIHRVSMASETDGVHQDDHLYFGLLPYSTQKRDPRLEVTKDAFDALQKAGVPEVPESHRRLSGYPVVRLIYPGRTEYCVQFETGKKGPKVLADFYARNLSKPVRRSDAVVESVQGICPDGKTRLEFTALRGVSAPAQLRFWTLL